MVSMFPWPWSSICPLGMNMTHDPIPWIPLVTWPWHIYAAKNEVLDSFMPQVQGGFAKKFGVWQFGTLKKHVQRYIDNIRLNYTCFAQATLGARMHYGHPAAWICERAPTKISGLMDRNWGSDHTGRIYGSKWWFMDRSSSPTPSPMGQSISTLKPPQRWKGTMDLYGGNWCFMMFPLVAARGCSITWYSPVNSGKIHHF